MQAFEDIERQLWEYLDNTCSEKDRIRIATLLRTDTTWKTLYDELHVLHNAIAAMEPNEPSLRFTKNVMEATSEARVAPRIEKYLNRKVIIAITVFFIVSLGSMLLYTLVHANRHASDVATPSPMIGTAFFISPVLLQASMYACTLALLAFIDSLLRKARKNLPDL